VGDSHAHRREIAQDPRETARECSERDADHLDHDLVTIRITKARFERQPGYEAARLIRVLRKAGWQPAMT
jgi:hypothetical protein